MTRNAATPTPHDVHERTRARQIDRLVNLASTLGLTPTDVDESVYDVVHACASNAYNADACPELIPFAAFDAVHDAADERASTISNGGLRDQIECLLDAFGEGGVRQTLLSLVADA